MYIIQLFRGIDDFFMDFEQMTSQSLPDTEEPKKRIASSHYNNIDRQTVVIILRLNQNNPDQVFLLRVR